MDIPPVEVIIPTVIAIIGIIVTIVQRAELNKSAAVVVPYLEALMAYKKGFEDKNLSDEDLIAVGKKASAHFAALDAVFKP